MRQKGKDLGKTSQPEDVEKEITRGIWGERKTIGKKVGQDD